MAANSHHLNEKGKFKCRVLADRWKDLDFEKGVLHVRQTLSHDGKQIYQDTKTKSSTRTISLAEEVLQQLNAHQVKIEEEKLAAGDDYADFDLVICTKLGKPINPRNLLREFYLLMEEASVKKIRFHDLRHTAASLLLSSNTNPKIVKEILGHSDVRVTLDVYSHVLPSVHKETAKQYGDMLFA
ncbi:site-specific integrase [Paenibacillus piri]|uniref:Site-specific integrase n=1 Tax=Paenibacillus piri TaxID=2547395 RepID=A0A4R5KH39_9BACL|nr:site-specific integrase [Paenibacillus piri]TDF94693.1 site-specific integrase [Paenibacillus piri]